MLEQGPAVGISIAILWLAAGYLLGLGLTALVRPAAAVKFLGAFAQTTRANWIEAALRAGVGMALVIAARVLPFSDALIAAGWFMVVTAIAMPAMPGLHRKFAKQAVAAIAPHIRLVGLGALACAAALGLLLGGGGH